MKTEIKRFPKPSLSPQQADGVLRSASGRKSLIVKSDDVAKLWGIKPNLTIKTREELIKKYTEFFRSKGHKEIPSSSLIPENDPTVLFTTAGMHPLVPFLLGQKHPLGKRLVDVQKCIRTGDIDEVGDEVHHTFFEMLGNWSLGDYFKKEAIEWSFEFLTSKEWLGISMNKLAISCFAGDKDAPKDDYSSKIWMSSGIPKERIAFLPKGKNWWGPAGETGPCGPDTEMFYWVGKEKTPKEFDPEDKRWVEIWNDVFMEYIKTKECKYEKAKQQNVDTGMGVERTLAVLQGKSDNYQTSIFLPVITDIENISKKRYKGNERQMRIIADHLRAVTFILGDSKGIKPSNLGQGYVLRRLIRRAIRYGKELGISNKFCVNIAGVVINSFKNSYPELERNKDFIYKELGEEELKFEVTLKEGLRVSEKLFSSKKPIKKEKFLKLMNLDSKKNILREIFNNKRNGKKYEIKEAGISEEEINRATVSGKEAFDLYQSFGFPIEMIVELVRERKNLVDIDGFDEEFKKHQDLSRSVSSGMFKSGLADYSDKTKRLHTATHLLNEVLRRLLGRDIKQKGSNITSERLRFDFNFPRKLTEEEIKKIEELVNKKINEELKVKREEILLQKAIDSGAQAEFGAKYPDIVSVYTIEDSNEKNGWFSKEICTGPHVENTKDIGKFKIIKEESVAAGIRRIKASVE
ncbi:MAG: alanine--tRNA ligase [Nanoarchaeota archaeon]|nr:alanine--tRNA ligase [Nanoarchaeota archaeon]